MARKPAKAQPAIHPKTSITEWIAAAAGLALTLGVIGYTAYEGLTSNDRHPSLSVETEPAQAAGGSYVVPIVVSNDTHATAASVEVIGTLSSNGAVVEERRVVLAYVPGKGEAHAGLVFEHDPKAYDLSVVPGGYEEP